MFGLRISRGFLGEDRLKIGLNGLFTGQRNYRAWGADLTFKLLAGSVLPEIRAEWVRSLRDPDGDRSRGNAFYIEADILKTDRIDLVASYADVSINLADPSKSFAPHLVAVYNPFFITTTERLFLRPVALGAIDRGGNTLADKVIDVRLGVKIFGKNPISLRWFTGDTATGADFGDVFTVAYRGWKIGRFALDVVYGNKTKGDTQVKQQYVGVAASTSF
jgi:hypothetical protein